MIDVFFTGYGEWWHSDGITAPFKACCEYRAHGIFRLSEDDEVEYKRTKKLFFSDALLTSSHPDSEFLRKSKQECLLGFNGLAKTLPKKASPEDYYFYVDKDKEFSLDIVSTSLLESDDKKTTKEPLTESESDKLLKQIGLLALVLAEKSNKFKKGSTPNALQITNNAQEILDASEFKGKKGTDSTEICNSINAGLKLLQSEDFQ